ncbi:UDP-3-O-(3-hydroxymyristoyl)glucosamine N-acyltransferase [Taibaiella sp. KBW10]|uniref:UDP-3-O-(3-hydroxymyristoyl)glucosamine N-acyltransferase n=1 Tax=Taibaiella sp. KBW10 TaxID=2153357 RepID=UPI000F59FEB2|nr:UDP-3-O-(3-hydroxymyristoyl)glucosamine N-acyltransferase [Taibaiella sp. KBW10]RQO32439.1 UDP-3-O-(3-hydroxymyristoyl)glucosamine N-acyltransferase [Taibaiella sp. KBW10]
MQFTAIQIAQLLQGSVEGNPEAVVSTFSKIEEAGAQSLCFIANPKYEHYLYETQAAVVVVNDNYVLTGPVSATLIRVADAYAAFAQLLQVYEQFTKGQKKTGIEAQAFVADSASVDASAYIGAFSYISEHAVIGKNVQIYPNCFIGSNAVIAEDSIIYPSVTIYKDCIVGQRVIIHSGTVIGADGFGFAPKADGSYDKVPQIGNVVIEDDVEIGANTCIDRATMGSTLIKKGAKLDNLLQVAHNVEIGESTVIAAQTGISGSTKLGAHCVVGGQVGIVGHISLANGTKINAKSGVSKTIVKEDTAISGIYAFDYKSEMKSQIVFRSLPDMMDRIKSLEAKIQALEQKNV